jgi:hypothetical protein
MYRPLLREVLHLLLLLLLRMREYMRGGYERSMKGCIGRACMRGVYERSV